MSAEHHYSQEEAQSQKRFIEEMLHKAEPRFPRGKINPDDMGELAFAVAADLERKAVIVRFAKPVDWVGLDRDSALHLANLLIEKAASLTSLTPDLTIEAQPKKTTD